MLEFRPAVLNEFSTSNIDDDTSAAACTSAFASDLSSSVCWILSFGFSNYISLARSQLGLQLQLTGCKLRVILLLEHLIGRARC